VIDGSNRKLWIGLLAGIAIVGLGVTVVVALRTPSKPETDTTEPVAKTTPSSPPAPDAPAIDAAVAEPGKPDRDAIEASMRAVEARVLACGNQFPIRGTVRLKLTASPDGHITEAAVLDAKGQGPIAGCLVAAVKTARLPATNAPWTFLFPFRFR
jgi:hypothetical protein